MKNNMRPVPPGEIHSEEFLKPLGMTANALAKAIGVPANRITTILNGDRGITGNTAVRLGTFFDTTPEFWMNLQTSYELRLAEKALPKSVKRNYRSSKDYPRFDLKVAENTKTKSSSQTPNTLIYY